MAVPPPFKPVSPFWPNQELDLMTLVCPFQLRIICDSIQGTKCISWTRPGIPQPCAWWLVAACTAHTTDYSHCLFPPKLYIPILLAAVSGVTPQSHPWPVSCCLSQMLELPHGWPLILALRAGLNHPRLACESIYFNTVKLVHSLDSMLGLGAKIHADV